MGKRSSGARVTNNMLRKLQRNLWRKLQHGQASPFEVQVLVRLGAAPDRNAKMAVLAWVKSVDPGFDFCW